MKVCGFVTKMAEWMTACDAIITKAGPGTIAEALICGLPIILNGFIPCQVRCQLWLLDDDQSSSCFVQRTTQESAALLHRVKPALCCTEQNNLAQEEGNVPFVVDNRVGLFEKKPTAIAAILEGWLTHEKAEFNSFAERAREIGGRWKGALLRIVVDLAMMCDSALEIEAIKSAARTALVQCASS